MPKLFAIPILHTRFWNYEIAKSVQKEKDFALLLSFRIWNIFIG